MSFYILDNYTELQQKIRAKHVMLICRKAERCPVRSAWSTTCGRPGPNVRVGPGGRPRTGATVQGCCRGRALPSSPQPPRLARTASPRMMFLLLLGGKGWSKVNVPRPGDPVFVTRCSYLDVKISFATLSKQFNHSQSRNTRP